MQNFFPATLSVPQLGQSIPTKSLLLELLSAGTRRRRRSSRSERRWVPVVFEVNTEGQLKVNNPTPEHPKMPELIWLN